MLRWVAAGVVAVLAVAGCSSSGGSSGGSSTTPAPTGTYLVMSPGPVLDALGADPSGHPIVDILGHPANRVSGHLDLTTVEVGQPITGPSIPSAQHRPNATVVPYGSVYPSSPAPRSTAGVVAGDVNSALAAAYCQLGYPKALTVTSVETSGPAAHVLQPWDVLVSVAGRSVSTVDTLRAALAAQPAGDTTVAVRRGGVAKTLTVRLGPASATARLGVSVDPRCVPPFTVRLNGLADIGGPAIGLMVALAVIDKLAAHPLSGTATVAGTGVVGADGRVGAVGAPRLELIGARDEGARTFLVPSRNCAEVRGFLGTDADLIKVDTLQGAWQALLDRQSGRPVPHC